MKRYFCVLLLLLALASLFSCGDVGEDDLLFYQRGGFEASINVTNDNGFEFSGVLFAEAEREDGAERDIKFVYTAPKTVEGIEVARKDGIYRISYGELTLPYTGDLSSLVSLFEIDGRPLSFEVKGETTLALIRGAKGEIYSLILGENGLPKRINKEGGAEVGIEHFERK